MCMWLWKLGYLSTAPKYTDMRDTHPPPPAVILSGSAPFPAPSQPMMPCQLVREWLMFSTLEFQLFELVLIANVNKYEPGQAEVNKFRSIVN